MSRENIAALLTANQHGSFCTGEIGQSKSVSNLGIGAQATATTSGRPAGSCMASYTDASEKPPGRVETAYAVADEAKLYLLRCDTVALNQEEAVLDWIDTWRAVISRMEKSLILP